MYCLVDCNNFFVSCERAFQPQLEGLPVVVLSNNDGCVVARSNESKAMGIRMGTPFFKVKHLMEEGRLHVRSSNYTLYGDLSRRVMSILCSEAENVEIYSIDEAFLLMDGMPAEELVPFCRCLVRKIRQWVGIPVSIGIAETKTLAKVANYFAKHYPGYRGVCTIDTDQKREKALQLMPIKKVWGIGWHSAPKMEQFGIRTAWDFTQRPQEWVQKRMSITGVHTWMELRGERAVVREAADKRQSICTSRSFADMIDSMEEMTFRISDFAARCAEKLRRQDSAAYTVGIFMQTNRFREDLQQYYPYETLRLEVPASSNTEIVGAALKLMKKLFRPGYKYKRAGVIVSDIVDADTIQPVLFGFNAALRQKENRASEVMDAVNTKDSHLLRLATQRAGHYADGIRMEHRSNRYSTNWNELIEVH